VRLKYGGFRRTSRPRPTS